ncbi:MAG: 4'-phosphopantetheinyl transferase superfamily protein [Anaerolineae bacterium]|nr:4'-phosphopantetheinyl transferase superfamily protein [Anaerolineae bacterium]
MTKFHCAPCSGGALRRPEGIVHWLVQSADAHPALGQGQAPLGLLHPVEAERLAGLTHPKRRADWLLGRWTAKHLLQSMIQHELGDRLPLNTLLIQNDRDGSPYASVEWSVASSQYSVASSQYSVGSGQSSLINHQSSVFRLPVSLSISHSGTHAFCAVSDGGLGSREWDSVVSVPTPQSLISVGADIEHVERRGHEFVTDFFTETEQAEVEAAATARRDTSITAMWSAKEAALKALRLGLTVDTRRVTCSLTWPAMPTWDGWADLTVAAPDLLSAPGRLIGWWQILDDYVLTLVVKHDA